MSLPIQPTEKLCCFPLEAGVKTWGWISVVMNALSAIGSVILLVTDDRGVSTDTSTELIAAGGGHISSSSSSTSSVSLLAAHIIYSVMIAMSLLSIGTSYMLVMAVNQRKRSLLLPYLIGTLLSITFWVIVMLPLLLPVFLVLSPLGLFIYLCFCVYSLFVRLRAEEENQQNQYNEASKVTSPQYAN